MRRMDIFYLLSFPRLPTSEQTHMESLENRLRWPLEVFAAMRAEWPIDSAYVGAHIGE